MIIMMKKLYQTAFLAGCLFSLPACDSYLDIQPVGKVIPSTLEDYRALLATAYDKKMSDRGVCELRTDAAFVSASSSYDVNIYQDIEIWNDVNPGASTRQFGWSDYYSNIYYANAIISKQDEIADGSPEDVNQLVGEAYMMRGYMHFLLVNLYGEPYTKAGGPESKAVPLKWDMDLEGTPGRVTVKEIYDAVLSDIARAKTLMSKDIWETQYIYRFSSLAAEALESRVYLYMGEWEKAYQAAEQVLKVKADLVDLNASGGDTPKLPGEFDSAEMINAYEIICGESNAPSIKVAAAFVERYENGKDLRRATYFSQNDNGNYISVRGGKSQYKCSFRTGELYLNAAEAAARLGKLPEARERLLQLVKNRYTQAGYEEKAKAAEAMGQEELVQEILDERMRELAFEGHYWFDLRRTSRPRIEKEIGGKSYVLEENDSRYTLRIPQDAIDANPGLQN